ncbi:E3 SUMO-protein ligase KIAA1586-like [Larimichthys crocea]|uniref:E3 SUMO-protein ligase KIAA1586-like n=1 Tax=Larimichthys crocea TaxID=215358 RepID=UPI000F5D898B|nr:E3 SUMO-protein ligase KIAA1586-like [Larimichthys crocea]
MAKRSGQLDLRNFGFKIARSSNSEADSQHQHSATGAEGDPETKRMEQEQAGEARAEDVERGSEEEAEAGQGSDADDDGPSCQGDDQDIPDCWTSDIFRQKKKQYPWLICQNKKLGCLTCQKIKSVGPNAGGSHVHVVNEWSNVKVTVYGATRVAQLQSLHKKIHKHRMSDYHQAAEKSMEKAKEKRMETLTSDMQRDHFLSTDRVFRTVYKIVKSGRPFTDLPIDIDLQVLNGLDMGRTLHSDHSCATISQHIANQMRERVVGKVLQSGTKFSILIDESTTESKKSVLIIYVRASLGMSEEQLHDVRQIQRGMREYIDMARLKPVDEMKPPEELKPLLQAVDALVISTAECVLALH